MPAAHRSQHRGSNGRQNGGMKRRLLLSELGIAPGNLVHALGYVRATKHISAGDIMSIVSIGGNGRYVKLLAILARGGNVSISFNADAYTALQLRSIA